MRRTSLLVTSIWALAACGGGETGTRGADTPPPDGAGPDAAVETSTACGNGLIEGDEACDDGPNNGAWGACLPDCSGPGARCGDGRVDTEFEVCDDGAANGAYGRCSVGCNGPAPFCGNGFTEPEHGEACDSGTLNGTYGYCRAGCAAMGPVCGDGVTDEPFERCDAGPFNGTPECPEDCGGTAPSCGDGDKDRGEACDDGAANGSYGHCAGDCSGPGPGCGDGLVHKPEVCDHGALNGTYGHCAADCGSLGPRCGDRQLQPPEVCDDGPSNGEPGFCRRDCTGTALPWTVGPGVAGRGVPGSCDPNDWFSKYLTYRLRFRGDGTAANPGFIIPGEGVGTAMPASRRQPGVQCAGHWEFGDCPRPDYPDARGLYKWGDGTSWLGHYLDVLAMEYAVFSDLGLPVDETLLDLKQALMAYRRLDESAETYFGRSPKKDGFFLRDDLQADQVKRPDGSYRFPRADGYAGYECLNGDIACHAPSTEDGSYTSQDQSIALLHGLALVARLVPDDVVVDGVPLRQEARESAHVMTLALRDNGWKVTDPNGVHPPDAWGGNALGFSNHIAQAANAICGEDFGVSDYRNLLSRTAGESAWVGLQATWGLTPWFNRVMAFMLAAVDGSWDADKITAKALGNGTDYYAMTWAILHDATLPAPWSDWRVEALLDSAPCSVPCTGVAAEFGGCTEVPGWRSESRVLQPGDVEGSRHVREAEFNGLDYMGYYLAYYLYKKGHVGFAVPDYDRGCGGARMLDAILAGPVEGETYDPSSACIGVDMAKRFCGRPWATWLDDAYGGRVAIYTGGKRWRCSPGSACVLTADGTAHTDGDDLVFGTGGNDELEGGGGNDCLVGLGGDDILEGNQGYDTLDGGDGNDQLYGESGNLIVVDGENDVLWGGPGADKLHGGPADDWLFGGEGDDEIVGDAGSDSLDGAAGNDDLYGDLGEDRLRGGDGDDHLDCGFGDDTAWGGPGRDKIDGDLGSDALDGGEGDDFVRGGMGDDTILDPAGADRLCGNGGDDTIWADWSGNDQCLGGGWLVGGTDQVNGCTDETASSGDCDKGAYDDW